MSHNTFLLTCSVFFISASLLLAADPRDFRKSKPLEIINSDAELGVFLPDEELYAGTQILARDIRLFGADGSETPFSVTRMKKSVVSKTSSSSVGATIREFSENDDGSVRILCSIENSERVNALRIVTRARDFDKYVKIFAAEDLSHPLVEGAFFDYSSRIDLRNFEFQLDEQSPSGNYVIIIDKYSETKESPVATLVSGDSNTKEQIIVTEKPKIDGIRFSILRNTTVLQDVLQSIPCDIISREEKMRDVRSTVLTFSTHKMPLGSISVSCSDPIFSRRYTLFNGNNHTISSGTIAFSNIASYTTNRTTIACDTGYAIGDTWTLVIANGDLPPLHDLNISCSGPVEFVSFVQKGATLPLSCYFGADSATYPRYEGITDILNTIDPKEPRISARLQPAVDNPVYSAFAIHGLSSYGKMAFYVIMGLAIIVAVFFIARNIGKIEKIED